jgi:hypothetical protein
MPRFFATFARNVVVAVLVAASELDELFDACAKTTAPATARAVRTTKVARIPILFVFRSMGESSSSRDVREGWLATVRSDGQACGRIVILSSDEKPAALWSTRPQVGL